MKKNLLIAILGLAVVVLLAVVLWSKGPDKKKEYTKEDVGQEFVDENGGTNKVVKAVMNVDGNEKEEIEVVPLVRSVERRPLEPEATKRLHDGPVIVTALFEASGRGEHGSYGKTIRGSYLYTTTVRARSEIVSKEENAVTGTILVVEKRTFTQALDNLALSDVDVAIDLETLPVKQVKGWCDDVCDFFITGFGGYIPGAAPIAKTIKAGAGAIFNALNRIDGTSARRLLGVFDVEVPDDIDAYVSKRIAQTFGNDIHVALQSIQGKTYIITYKQAANGMPLNVDFTHEDGEPITEAEWEILRCANAFLDSNAVPDTRCRVGQSWTIWADEVQELFGAAGEGRADGKVKVVRVDDQPDGDWTLKIEPSEITFRSNTGTTSGRMKVKDGNGLVDAENASVKSLQTTAEGSLHALNKKRHALFFDFVKKINGDAHLRFILTVDPAE